MLQLHDAKHFRFDGELKEGWLLVNTTNDTTFSIGRKKSIQTEDGVLQPIFKGITSELPSFNFEIFKVDESNDPCEMTREDIFELNRWLDRNEPRALEVDGFIYYGLFSPQTGIWYPNNWGRIELKFDMILPYAFMNVIDSTITVNGVENIKIKNKSNVHKDYVYPDIEIKVISGDEITIKNLTNGQETILSNLTAGNTYTIYNQEKQMINEDNVRENVYLNSNKKYQNLEYGINRFRISNNGKMIIKISYQPKVCLQ